MTTQNTSAIVRAVELADGVEKLADACGVSAQAVYKWIKKGHPPTDRCASIERAVGGAVSRFDLLPPAFAAQSSAGAPAELATPSNTTPASAAVRERNPETNA
jgi:DNA-binding transcriptional regulator YdaS (Cro superfamily)